MNSAARARLRSLQLLLGIFFSVCGASAASAESRIEVVFSYLGKPVSFMSDADGFCRNETSGKVVNCHFGKDEQGRYWIDRLPPGRYALQVSVDENRKNPPQGPGDYERYFQFKVDKNTTGPLRVTMQKLIRLISPADNNGDVAGNSGSCEKKAVFEVPLASPTSEAEVEFAWEPMAPGVTYHYTLWKANCKGGGMQRLRYKQTTAMQVRETIPPSTEGEFYLFRITAVKNGEMVGNFVLRDNGGSGMRQYRFRVIDPLGNRYYIFGGVGIALLLLVLVVARKRRGKTEKKSSTTRAGSSSLKSLLILIVVPSLAAGGYYGYEYYLQYQKEQAKLSDRSKLEERQAHMRADFELNVPLPYWWKSIGQPSYLFNSHSDVVAVWPKVKYGSDGLVMRRETIKRCYLSIVAHANDDNLVSACLSMIANLAEDRQIMLKAAEFGVKHYFNHKHTTDYCSGCMPGDTSAELVLKAAIGYKWQDKTDRAIKLIKRFLKAREKETSPYKLVSLYTQLGTAYWDKGDKRQAMAVLESTKQRYGKSAVSKNLEYILERYREKLQAEAQAQPAPPPVIVSKAETVESKPAAATLPFPQDVSGTWLARFDNDRELSLSGVARPQGIAIQVHEQQAQVALIDAQGQRIDLGQNFSVIRVANSMTIMGKTKHNNMNVMWSINVADIGRGEIGLSVVCLEKHIQGGAVRQTKKRAKGMVTELKS